MAVAVTDRVRPGRGVAEPLDDDSCLLHLGADNPRELAWTIAPADADSPLTHAPPELTGALRSHAARRPDALHRGKAPVSRGHRDVSG